MFDECSHNNLTHEELVKQLKCLKSSCENLEKNNDRLYEKAQLQENEIIFLREVILKLIK